MPPKATILVVEDNRDIRQALEILLTRAGYAVQSAGDSYAALHLLAESPADLILVDTMMAGMTGRELLARLDDRMLTQVIPVIVLSSSPDVAQTAQELHAAGYLSKPIEADSVIAEINRCLGEQS